MQRKVEGLENLNNILTLPIGSKFGMFADDSITLWDPWSLTLRSKMVPRHSSSA